MDCIGKELVTEVWKLWDSGAVFEAAGLWMVVSRLAWRHFVSKLCGWCSVRSCMGSSVSGTLG